MRYWRETPASNPTLASRRGRPMCLPWCVCPGVSALCACPGVSIMRACSGVPALVRVDAPPNPVATMKIGKSGCDFRLRWRSHLCHLAPHSHFLMWSVQRTRQFLRRANLKRGAGTGLDDSGGSATLAALLVPLSQYRCCYTLGATPCPLLQYPCSNSRNI